MTFYCTPLNDIKVLLLLLLQTTTLNGICAGARLMKLSYQSVGRSRSRSPSSPFVETSTPPQKNIETPTSTSYLPLSSPSSFTSSPYASSSFSSSSSPLSSSTGSSALALSNICILFPSIHGIHLNVYFFSSITDLQVALSLPSISTFISLSEYLRYVRLQLAHQWDSYRLLDSQNATCVHFFHLSHHFSTSSASVSSSTSSVSPCDESQQLKFQDDQNVLSNCDNGLLLKIWSVHLVNEEITPLRNQDLISKYLVYSCIYPTRILELRSIFNLYKCQSSTLGEASAFSQTARTSSVKQQSENDESHYFISQLEESIIDYLRRCLVYMKCNRHHALQTRLFALNMSSALKLCFLGRDLAVLITFPFDSSSLARIIQNSVITSPESLYSLKANAHRRAVSLLSLSSCVSTGTVSSRSSSPTSINPKSRGSIFDSPMEIDKEQSAGSPLNQSTTMDDKYSMELQSSPDDRSKYLIDPSSSVIVDDHKGQLPLAVGNNKTEQSSVTGATQRHTCGESIFQPDTSIVSSWKLPSHLNMFAAKPTFYNLTNLVENVSGQENLTQRTPLIPMTYPKSPVASPISTISTGSNSNMNVDKSSDSSILDRVISDKSDSNAVLSNNSNDFPPTSINNGGTDPNWAKFVKQVILSSLPSLELSIFRLKSMKSVDPFMQSPQTYLLALSQQWMLYSVFFHYAFPNLIQSSDMTKPYNHPVACKQALISELFMMPPQSLMSPDSLDVHTLQLFTLPPPRVCVRLDRMEPREVPFSTLGLWQKAGIHPISSVKNCAYLVIPPSHQQLPSDISNSICLWFLNLSDTYEICNLGRHRCLAGHRSPLLSWKLEQSLPPLVFQHLSSSSSESTSPLLSQRIQYYKYAFYNILVQLEHLLNANGLEKFEEYDGVVLYFLYDNDTLPDLKLIQNIFQPFHLPSPSHPYFHLLKLLKCCSVVYRFLPLALTSLNLTDSWQSVALQTYAKVFRFPLEDMSDVGLKIPGQIYEPPFYLANTSSITYPVLDHSARALTMSDKTDSNIIYGRNGDPLDVCLHIAFAVSATTNQLAMCAVDALGRNVEVSATEVSGVTESSPPFEAFDRCLVNVIDAMFTRHSYDHKHDSVLVNPKLRLVFYHWGEIHKTTHEFFFHYFSNHYFYLWNALYATSKLSCSTETDTSTTSTSLRFSGYKIRDISLVQLMPFHDLQFLKVRDHNSNRHSQQANVPSSDISTSHQLQLEEEEFQSTATMGLCSIHPETNSTPSLIRPILYYPHERKVIGGMTTSSISTSALCVTLIDYAGSTLHIDDEDSFSVQSQEFVQEILRSIAPQLERHLWSVVQQFHALSYLYIPEPFYEAMVFQPTTYQAKDDLSIEPEALEATNVKISSPSSASSILHSPFYFPSMQPQKDSLFLIESLALPLPLLLLLRHQWISL